jgi:hypothetical protein
MSSATLPRNRFVTDPPGRIASSAAVHPQRDDDENQPVLMIIRDSVSVITRIG